jgi:hypothetical protein
MWAHIVVQQAIDGPTDQARNLGDNARVPTATQKHNFTTMVLCHTRIVVG